MSAEAAEFSLWRGGPSYRMGQRNGLIRGDRKDGLRRAAALIAIAWAPCVLLAVVWQLLGRGRDPLLFQLEVHVRWLVAVPLLLIAEVVVDDRIARSLRYLRAGEIVPLPAQPLLGDAEEHIGRWRDSSALELAVLLVAVLVGLRGMATAASPAQLWHAAVALSLFRFVLYRWVLRWVLWAILLARIATLDLQLIGIHPDRAGGLGVLVLPSRAFGLVAAAFGAMLSAAWGMRMLHGMRFAELYPFIAGYLVIVLVFALLPLLVFLPALARAKRMALYDYGLLARRYTAAFSDRWLGVPEESPLGSPDIQSLADLGGGFDVVREMRPVPFSGRVVVELAVIALLPLLPLYLASTPVRELVGRLVRLVF